MIDFSFKDMVIDLGLKNDLEQLLITVKKKYSGDLLSSLDR